ncbi:MAG: selenide, water dikinase SelD [Paracoccaceae bacterium]
MTQTDDQPDTPRKGASPQGSPVAARRLADLGLPTQDGFLKVSAQLQTADPAIFAVGDCAHMTDTPRPKAGVFAVRQAPVLAHNVRAALTGGALQSYKPQRDYLKLVSLGGKSALAEKAGLPVQGPLMWRWKDHIDQTFMRQFKGLKPMEPPPPPKVRALGARPEYPLCTGCGAKVGRSTLRAAIAIPTEPRADVTMLPGDDAALLQVGGAQQVLTTDHLSAVLDDPVVFARIAAIHALGDVWAMGAAPQAVLAQIILPRLAPDLQARTLSEIMTAASEVFTQAGAQIVGGHTTQGDGLTVGFTVSGLCDGAPVTLAGACPGDALILTKPLGTGVILAAEMQMKAPGAVVQSALNSMTRSQVSAAQILRQAHAMTDVTGFGLAGHLDGMMQASGTSACLDLAAVPMLPGARALSDAGVRSSLFADNRALVPDLPEDTETRLLFDPQTAGGLLAAVAPDQAANTLERLCAAGYAARVIGEVQAGSPYIILR